MLLAQRKGHMYCGISQILGSALSLGIKTWTQLQVWEPDIFPPILVNYSHLMVVRKTLLFFVLPSNWVRRLPPPSLQVSLSAREGSLSRPSGSADPEECPPHVSSVWLAWGDDGDAAPGGTQWHLRFYCGWNTPSLIFALLLWQCGFKTLRAGPGVAVRAITQEVLPWNRSCWRLAEKSKKTANFLPHM